MCSGKRTYKQLTTRRRFTIHMEIGIFIWQILEEKYLGMSVPQSRGSSRRLKLREWKTLTTKFLIVYQTFKMVFNRNLQWIFVLFSYPNRWKVVRKRQHICFNLFLDRDAYKHLEKNTHLLFKIRQKSPNNFPYTQQLQGTTTLVGNRETYSQD